MSCSQIQDRFTEYLDGRLNGREMQRIAAHLDHCPACSRRWDALKQTQLSLASLGSIAEPEDMLLRIRVALSQEKARRQVTVLAKLQLAWKNTVGPFILQAAAGFCSAVLLLGTVTLMVGMFTPQSAEASKDEPLGAATPARLLYLSSGAGGDDIGAVSGPVVVEVYINGNGQMYDYRIVSGPTDAQTRAQVENLLLLSRFEPARFFGRPVRGLAVLSFSGVSVRG